MFHLFYPVTEVSASEKMSLAVSTSHLSFTHCGSDATDGDVDVDESLGCPDISVNQSSLYQHLSSELKNKLQVCIYTSNPTHQVTFNSLIILNNKKQSFKVVFKCFLHSCCVCFRNFFQVVEQTCSSLNFCVFIVLRTAAKCWKFTARSLQSLLRNTSLPSMSSLTNTGKFL